jgi:hypothetical protein
MEKRGMTLQINRRTLQIVLDYLGEMSAGAVTTEVCTDGAPTAMVGKISYHLAMAESYRILTTSEPPRGDMKEIREACEAEPGGLDWYRKGLSAAKRRIDGD